MSVWNGVIDTSEIKFTNEPEWTVPPNIPFIYEPSQQYQYTFTPIALPIQTKLIHWEEHNRFSRMLMLIDEDWEELQGIPIEYQITLDSAKFNLCESDLKINSNTFTYSVST